MATASPAVSGWTAGSIGPSWLATQNVLGRQAPTAPAYTPAQATMGSQVMGSAGGGYNPFMGATGGGASPPVQGGGGYNSQRYNVPTSYGGFGGGPQVPGTGQLDDPRGNAILTPEQAYANYLQKARTYAETMTPAQAAFNDYARLLQHGGAPPQSYGIGGGNATDAYTQRQQQSAGVLQSMLLTGKFSPNSFAYGTPAANAPAPTPQWGYPGGYGQAAPGYQGAGPSAGPVMPYY